MKASKFSENQIAFVLRQGEEGTAVEDGLPQSGNQPSDLLQLEEEVWWASSVGDEAIAPARGRERPAEADRGGPVARQRDAAGRYQAKALRPARKRQLVDQLRSTWKVSIRRACRVVRADTSSYHYKSRRGGQAELKARIKEIAETRVRYGYRRIHVFLLREGWSVNVKRVYRLYRELGLQLRNKTPKRRVKAKLGDDRKPASRSLSRAAAALACALHLAQGRAMKQRLNAVIHSSDVVGVCSAFARPDLFFLDVGLTA